MKIIFDYNRTLYDPEAGQLYVGALDTLTNLKAAGHDLHLLSAFEGHKAASIESLGISHFFTSINLVPEKTPAEFSKIAGDDKQAIAIGDKLRGEINVANQLGLTTIWIKQGKYSSLSPQTDLEVPDYTVTDISQLGDLIASLA
jgi:FMN phosphatase YigB (HAD superfamily)